MRNSRLGKIRAFAVVGIKIVAVFAAFPTIGEVFSEVIVAAGHPVAEGPEQAAGERSERGAEVLLLAAWPAITIIVIRKISR